MRRISGGVFIVSTIIWGRIVDKKKHTRYEIVDSIIAITGAIVIFMRHSEEAFLF